jgi:hypothetical protein
MIDIQLVHTKSKREHSVYVFGGADNDASGQEQFASFGNKVEDKFNRLVPKIAHKIWTTSTIRTEFCPNYLFEDVADGQGRCLPSEHDIMRRCYCC